MNARIIKDDFTGKNWQRVSKASARKGFNTGKNICICAVNMMPFNSHWAMGYIVNKDGTGDIIMDCDWTFDKLVNNYEWYNCNDETGKYSAFYMEVE